MYRNVKFLPEMKVLVLNPHQDESPENIAKLVNGQVKKTGMQVCICLSNIKGLSKHEIDIPVFCMGTSKLKEGETIEFKDGNHAIRIGCGKPEKRVDILVSKEWPRTIAIEQQHTEFSSPELDSVLRNPPRYWFASGLENNSFFLERQAFEVDSRTCRFISLAKKGQGRWYYAFNLPFEDDITSIKTLQLPNLSIKRKAEDTHSENGVKRLHSITPMDCFLCPVNPKFESHLVIDKSPNAYMVTTKGPLGLDNGKGFIGHGMIVPIEHSPKLPQPLLGSSFYEQLKTYETNLVKMFMSPTSDVKNSSSFSLLFWHISNNDQVHGHVQFLPILNSQARKLEDRISQQIELDERYAKKKSLKKPKLELLKFGSESDDLKSFWSIVDSQPYVCFILHTNEGVSRFIIPLAEGVPFDNLFPRKVVAGLINQKDKINWKKCLRGEEVEKTECEEFKRHYKLV